MKLKVVVHEAEEGGCWRRSHPFPDARPGGESFEALLANLYEAVEGCLSVDARDVSVSGSDRVIEISV